MQRFFNVISFIILWFTQAFYHNSTSALVIVIEVQSMYKLWLVSCQLYVQRN